MYTYQEIYDEYLNNRESFLNFKDPGEKLNFLDSLEGPLTEMLERGVFGGWSRTAGVEFNIDKVSQESYLQSRNYEAYTTGWRIDSAGNIEGKIVVLGGSGELRFYKTDGTLLGKVKSDGTNPIIFFDASTDAQIMFYRTGANVGELSPTGTGAITLGSATYPWQGAKIEGLSTLTNVTAVGDVSFLGGGSGLVFGDIYSNIANNITCNTQNAWYTIIQDVAGAYNLTTPSDALDGITVSKTGIYKIGLTVCAHSHASNHFEFAAFKDTTQIPNLIFHQDTPVAGKEENMGGSSIYAISDTDVVRAKVRCVDAAGKVITIDHVNLNLTMVGGGS